MPVCFRFGSKAANGLSASVEKVFSTLSAGLPVSGNVWRRSASGISRDLEKRSVTVRPFSSV
jgi:hypothetical protein